MIKPTTNNIHAMLVAAPATPLNPRTPAMIAITRNVRAHCNIVIPLFSAIRLSVRKILQLPCQQWYGQPQLDDCSRPVRQRHRGTGCGPEQSATDCGEQMRILGRCRHHLASLTSLHAFRVVIERPIRMPRLKLALRVPVACGHRTQTLASQSRYRRLTCALAERHRSPLRPSDGGHRALAARTSATTRR